MIYGLSSELWILFAVMFTQIWWGSNGWWRNWGYPRPTWSWKKWLLRWRVATATLSTTGTLWRWCWASVQLCSNCKYTSVRCEPYRGGGGMNHELSVSSWSLDDKWWYHCLHAGLVEGLHGNKTHLYSLYLVSLSVSLAGIMCLTNQRALSNHWWSHTLEKNKQILSTFIFCNKNYFFQIICMSINSPRWIRWHISCYFVWFL